MIKTNGITGITNDDDGNIIIALRELVTGINYVFRYDSVMNDWVEQGGPTSDNRVLGNVISELQSKNGVLYAYSKTTNGLFAYVDLTWKEIGSLNKPIQGLAVADDNDIYVVCNDTIHRWDGNIWNDITPGVGTFRTCAIDQSERFYITVDEDGINGFKVYDNGFWITLDVSPIDASTVSKMLCYNNRLYVAGNNITTGKPVVDFWNGVTWVELKPIVTDFPFVDGLSFSTLYVDVKGIYVTFINADLESQVLRNDGINWSSIGNAIKSNTPLSGNGGYGTGFARGSDGRLYVGGYIQEIDSSVSGNVARYLLAETDMRDPPPVI
jgi:hypothetical protein